MSLAIYSGAAFFVKGVMIAETTTVTVDHQSGNQDIITMGRGFAGVSPGAQRASVKFSNAVPRAGNDIDYIKSLQKVELLDVVLFARGKKLKSKGFLMSLSETYSAEKASEFSGEITCGPFEESGL